MSVYRVLRIGNGNPLNRIREFLSTWWSQIELEAMIAPVTLPDRMEVASQVIKDPADLAMLNPFAPFMLSNTASLIEDFLKHNFKRPVAIMLRPCELRTLIELQKRNRILMPDLDSHDLNNGIITIGIDCPGTFTAREFARQVERTNLDAITRKAINIGEGDDFFFEHQRKACQLCDWPAPCGADLTVGIFGTAHRQSLLLMALNHSIDIRMRLKDLADDLATEEDIASRENAIKSLLENRVARRKMLSFSEYRRSGELPNFLALFTRCTLCADCLDACPLYEGELSGLLGVGGPHKHERPLLAELIGVSRWLASCSGCGMCEEMCEFEIPLTLLISTISQRICEELGYTAGEPGSKLPWITA